jgi:hypothetical protein
MTLEMQDGRGVECGILVRDTLLECQCTALVFCLSASLCHQAQHRIAGNGADWNEPTTRKKEDAETGAEERDYLQHVVQNV